MIILVQKFLVNKLGNTFMRKIRIYRARSVPQAHCRLMDIADFRRLQNNRDCSTFFCAHKMLLNRRNRKKRRNRDMVLINSTVRKNHNIRAILVFPVNRNQKVIQRLLQRTALVIQKRNRNNLEPGLFHILDFQHINAGKNRVVNLKDSTVFSLRL